MTKYELQNRNSGASIGKLWWDGQKIQSTTKAALRMVEDEAVNGTSFKDGEKFLKNLPYLFKGGYILVKKVNE